MMGIETLIEGLKKSCWGKSAHVVDDERRKAATTLSTLQVENEKLRAELEQVKAKRDAAVALVHEWEQYGRYLSPMGFTVPPNWKED